MCPVVDGAETLNGLASSVILASPEDILLQKLRWYRRGGEVPGRQWRDIVAIILVHGERLDREYLREGSEILGVSDLLDRDLAWVSAEDR
jgi:hypothetical protein